MTNSIYSNTLKVWWTQGKKRGKLTHVYVLRFAFLDLTWDYPGNSFEFVPKIPDSIYFSLARAEKAAQSKWETEYDKILAKLPAEDSEREDPPPTLKWKRNGKEFAWSAYNGPVNYITFWITRARLLG